MRRHNSPFGHTLHLARRIEPATCLHGFGKPVEFGRELSNVREEEPSEVTPEQLREIEKNVAAQVEQNLKKAFGGSTTFAIKLG